MITTIVDNITITTNTVVMQGTLDFRTGGCILNRILTSLTFQAMNITVEETRDKIRKNIREMIERANTRRIYST